MVIGGDRTNDRIHICYDYYDSKEQWYLDNYSFIYSYSPKQYERKNTGYVKNDKAPCYVGNKSSDGKILKQRDCPHCSPWKFKDENINSDTGKQNISDRLTSHWGRVILGIVGIVSIFALIIFWLKSKNNYKRKR